MIFFAKGQQFAVRQNNAGKTHGRAKAIDTIVLMHDRQSKNP
jgi:hypothetical protein